MTIARLLVSAAHKSSGKTTVTLGLCAALAARGTVVQPFKKGPDYIDPMWLARAAGRPCFNLDAYLMDDAALVRCFADGLRGADLALVEGNKGLYDGLALDGSNSNAALARRLGLPVLLVIDARGMTRGIAPLILGYQAFDRDIRIGGVILNRLGGARHEAKLRAVIEHYTDVPVLGAVAEDARLAVMERHLGLMPCAELDDAQARVQAIGRIVGAQVDLDRVRALAASAGPGAAAAASRLRRRPQRRPADLRIGIARDRAFGFYYPDDLAALAGGGRRAGADRHPARRAACRRSTVCSSAAASPKPAWRELEANAPLRSAIARGHRGRPADLRRVRRPDVPGAQHHLAGPHGADGRRDPRRCGDARAAGGPRLRAPAGDGGACPGPGAGGRRCAATSSTIRASRTSTRPSRFAYRVQRGHGVDGAHDGVLVHNLLASYAHLRSAAGTSWAPRFVDFVRQQRERRSAAAAALAHRRLRSRTDDDPVAANRRCAGPRRRDRQRGLPDQPRRLVGGLRARAGPRGRPGADRRTLAGDPLPARLLPRARRAGAGARDDQALRAGLGRRHAATTTTCTTCSRSAARRSRATAWPGCCAPRANIDRR